MMKEIPSLNRGPSETARLAGLFNGLKTREDSAVFNELESDLENAGFERADAISIAEILHNPSFYCRSESFTRVMDLILEHRAIELTNTADDANMCRTENGTGFRVAMLEGFSGKDVNAATKVVITFSSNHLLSKKSIDKGSSLWGTKPETAAVSLRGKGAITFEDVKMASFRFPTKLFPMELLSEEEKERVEEGKINFVIRHFIVEQNKKSHDHAMVS